MANMQSSGTMPKIDVEGIDAHEVAGLLEEVAQQIRANNGAGAVAAASTSFKRVDTGQLYDLVHRS